MLFKSDRRKHVVGRGVLPRKDLAILMRGRSVIDDDLILQKRGSMISKKSSIKGSKSTALKSRGKSVEVTAEPIASTSGKVVDDSIQNDLTMLFLGT